MEIKAFYPEPNEIPVTLTITMTAGQWKDIRLSLENGKKGYTAPTNTLLQAIISVNHKLNQYTQPDEQKEKA